MSILSGKFGVVNGHGSVKNWQISDQQAVARAINSATKIGAARRKGPRSWSGSFAQHGAHPLVMPGDIFSFIGYTAPTNGIEGATGVTYEGDAIVDSIQVTWNWGAASLIETVVNFSGHLDLTKSSGAYEDVSQPDLLIPCGTIITYDETEWENLVQATLNITAANLSYVNSSTNCWTGRSAGPIDWTLSVVEQNHDRISALDVDSRAEFKLFVDANDYWRLKWGRVVGYSNLQVDRESGAIIQTTVNIEMDGVSPSTGLTGSIVPPGDVVPWWPIGSTSSSLG